MTNKESDVIGRVGSVIIFRVKRSDSSLVVERDSVREKGNAFAYRTGHRIQVGIWLPVVAIDAKWKGTKWNIQGVTGGTDQTSGECSLGQTIPI